MMRSPNATSARPVFSCRTACLLGVVLAACLAAALCPFALAASWQKGRPSSAAAKQGKTERPLTTADFGRFALLVPPLRETPQGTVNGTGQPLQPASGTAQAPADSGGPDAEPALREGTLYRVFLPPKVLLTSLRGDGRDLCVFNAEGKVVPFGLRVRERENTLSTHKITSLYPLWGKPQSGSEDLIVSFTLDEQSRLVPAVSGGKGLHSAPEGQELKGYVAPAPQEGILAASLTFVWTKGTENTVQFILQTGDDLKSWRTVASRASLVRFDGPDGPLESSSVQLGGARLGKYLRLLFEKGMAPADISAIEVEEWSSVRTVETFGPVNSHAVPEHQADARIPYSAAALEFFLPEALAPRSPAAQNGASGGAPGLAGVEKGALQVESLQLAGARPGEYAKVRILTRPGPDYSWQRQGEFTFFAVMRKDELLTNNPFPLGGQRVGQIRFEASQWGKALPESLRLDLTYVPVDLYFLAQGKGPYTLAWHGEQAVSGDDAGVFSLLSQTEAEPASLQFLAASPVSAPAAPAAPENSGMGRYLVWAALAAGVLLLGIMALQLARSMRKGQQ